MALGAGETMAGEGTDVVAVSARPAEGLLSCRGLAIARRAPVDGVGDIDAVAKLGRSQHLVQKLARLTHEWEALNVLISPRTLPDDNYVSRRISTPKHRLTGPFELQRAQVEGCDRFC